MKKVHRGVVITTTGKSPRAAMAMAARAVDLCFKFMPIQYEIEKIGPTKIWWRRKAGNYKIHSTGHETFKRRQGAIGAIFNDCGHDVTPERLKFAGHHLRTNHTDPYKFTSLLGPVEIRVVTKKK